MLMEAWILKYGTKDTVTEQATSEKYYETK
jgi:hypothetical protein